MTYDLVDHYGTPLGEFESLEDAVVALRKFVGSKTRRAYDLAILSFDDSDARVGGPITLDPANLAGPVIQHSDRAPAPPTPSDATNISRTFGQGAVRTFVGLMVQPAGFSAADFLLYRFHTVGRQSVRLPTASTG